MAFDAIFMSCLKKEIEDITVNMKISKVQQPERDIFLFTLRGDKLYVSLASYGARVSMTGESMENPMTPPMFCMLLRKHLTGGKIISLNQPHLERVYDFEIESYDQIGRLTKLHVIVELLGRYTNLIIADENMMIIDCVRRIGFDVSDKRQVLPGLLYTEPPKTGKRDPFEIVEGDIIGLLKEAQDVRLDKWINMAFDGFSPLICREIVSRAYGFSDVRLSEANKKDGGAAFEKSFIDLVNEVKDGKFAPYILYDESGKPFEYSFTEITQYGDSLKCVKCSDFSALMNEFYSKRDKIERTKTKTQVITKSIRRLRDRTERKVAAQKSELLETADREYNRENGDLITSNIYKMKKGMTVLLAEDYYDPDGGIREIKLDPLKTPQQNAAKYYRDYNKAKTAEIHLKEQIAKGERELDYLGSVLEALEKAETERDVLEIRQELSSAGYLKAQKSSKKERPIEQKPMHFRSSSGMDIYVGKNNAQNDRLTLKTAFKRDIWLHAQKIHGSHVVISAPTGEADDVTLTEAASLAAYYSQAKDSSNVPVDYTYVRFVKKPSGAKPGMVIYTDYKTLYVDPDDTLPEKLKIK